jgi:LuxR family maltose regulon positive regulatory protein
LIKRVPRPELEAYCVQLLAAFPRTESPDEIAVEQANARLTEPLTGRELEILRCIAETKDNEEISTALFISIYTVKKHITHLFAKLGAENRLQAVEKARSLGLLP